MNIFSRLPDDIIENIIERLAEAIFANPSLSSRKAIPYGLLSKAFYEAFKKRSVFYLDASDSSTITRKQMFEYKFSKIFKRGETLETFIITFTYEPQSYYYYDYLINSAPEYLKRLKTMNLNNLDRGASQMTAPVLTGAVFSVPTLEHLGLMGFCLYPDPQYGIKWPNLKRLCLDSVIMNWDVFTDMMSSSPSLENLVIRNYKEPWKMQVRTPGFKNLRTLHLDRCKGVDDSFFTDFGKKFPRLEEFCLQQNPNTVVSVKSGSLKKIRLVNMVLLKEAHFDVPNVVHFEFEGHYKNILDKNSKILPKVSVKTRSEGWTSVIKLGAKANSVTRELKKEQEDFKNGLQGSKIFLHYI